MASVSSTIKLWKLLCSTRERHTSGCFLACLDKCQKSQSYFHWNGCKCKKTPVLLQRCNTTFIVFRCFGLHEVNEQRSHPFSHFQAYTFLLRGASAVSVLYSPQFSGRALSPAAVSSGSTMWGRCSRWGPRDFWPRGPRCGWHLEAHTNVTSVMCSMLW